MVSIVFGFNIFDSKNLVMINIDDLESFLDEFFSEIIHFSNQGPKKLVVWNSSVSISVKAIKGYLELCIVEVESHFLHSLFEFMFVQGFVVVIVHNLEFSTHSNDASSSSGLQSFSD